LKKKPAEIHKRRRLASFLISAEADDALQEMQRGLNHAKTEMDWTAYMEKWSWPIASRCVSSGRAATLRVGPACPPLSVRREASQRRETRDRVRRKHVSEALVCACKGLFSQRGREARTWQFTVIGRSA
jgi:hypothetical protein